MACLIEGCFELLYDYYGLKDILFLDCFKYLLVVARGKMVYKYKFVFERKEKRYFFDWKIWVREISDKL